MAMMCDNQTKIYSTVVWNQLHSAREEWQIDAPIEECTPAGSDAGAIGRGKMMEADAKRTTPAGGLKRGHHLWDVTNGRSSRKWGSDSLNCRFEPYLSPRQKRIVPSLFVCSCP